MALAPSDFGAMARLLRAGPWGGKLVLGLEGGYSLDPAHGLPEAVACTCRALGQPLGTARHAPTAEAAAAAAAAAGVAAAASGAPARGARAAPASAWAAGSSALGLRSLWLRDFHWGEAWALLRAQRIGKREFVWSRALRFTMPPYSEV
jgi:hypothetical protein